MDASPIDTPATRLARSILCGRKGEGVVSTFGEGREACFTLRDADGHRLRDIQGSRRLTYASNSNCALENVERPAADERKG